MKYRHAFHAGNFADVHKHVTLIALLTALERKDKGFLYLETHAGRGAYDLGSAAARRGDEAQAGVERVLAAEPATPEIAAFTTLVRAFRKERDDRQAYPGSPIIAAHCLRSQDRAVFVEAEADQHATLASELRREQREAGRHALRLLAENGDGFARIPAWLPPLERRALLLIDPPYEQSREDFARVLDGAAAALARLPSAVIAIWYPIKLAADTARWNERAAARLEKPLLRSELWIHPRDSAIGLNGSGLLVVNPPHLLAERMQEWLPLLKTCLAPPKAGGSEVHLFGTRN